MTFLGIDLGTSSLKAVLVDADQRVLCTASVPLPVSRPAPGRSEQDPEDWWRATLAALDEIRAERPRDLSSVQGIGLAGQMHGAVCLGAADRVLRPCILWDDTRAAAECRELEDAFPASRAVTGNRAMPGFTAPKLLWMRRHEPEAYAATRRVLLPKAWLRLRMTGEAVEEMSDASGTLWLDVRARDWSDAALAATGLWRDAMPRLVEGSDAAGTLRPGLAARWGMHRPPVVAGGAGDNAAGAVGLGAVREGSAFVSLGTSGVVWATTGARVAPYPEAAVHAFCHALPGTWHQMGVTLSAAASLAWWAGVSGATEAALLAELPGDPAEVARAGPGEAVFLPYLSGERTPHDDAGLRAAFAGLSHATGRAALTRAVLEGVAYSLRDALDALAAAGTRVAEADVIGGGARSRAWVGILAAVLGVPLRRPAGGEHGPAFGAARLARLAATGEDAASVCLTPERAETTTPGPAAVAAYAAGLARYRALQRGAAEAPGLVPA